MQFDITGTPLPVVICELEKGESIKCEAGAMSWMSPNMEMETKGGGMGKMFGRMLSGEDLFQNIYTAQNADGMIAFSSCFPGSIKAIEITPDHPIVVQKGGYLASEMGVDLSIFFQKKMMTGFFGGEGFIMQKLSGNGTAFLEFDGNIVEYELGASEQLIVDTGHVAMMDASCKIEVVSVKGLKNKILGGEGLFNTVITGPGKVYLQTMPLVQFANSLSDFLQTSK